MFEILVCYTIGGVKRLLSKSTFQDEVFGRKKQIDMYNVLYVRYMTIIHFHGEGGIPRIFPNFNARTTTHIPTKFMLNNIFQV